MFDRPGFYRFHSKNTDTEYGMVKEEVSLAFNQFVRMCICVHEIKSETAIDKDTNIETGRED